MSGRGSGGTRGKMSGGDGTTGRGGGEPKGQGLVATEGHGRDNRTVHIHKGYSQGFPVAVEGHDVLWEVQHHSHRVSLAEEVVFAAEGVEKGAPTC